MSAGAARAAAPPLLHGTWVRPLVHEGVMLALMAGVMAVAALAGHGAAPMVGAALVFAVLSIGYAPLARTKAWAREHVVDLWAMLLVMVAQAVGAGAGGGAGSGSMAGMMGHAAAAPAHAAAIPPTATAALVAITLLGWLVARAVLARRTWRIHSVVSLLGCGACLLWMLLA